MHPQPRPCRQPGVEIPELPGFHTGSQHRFDPCLVLPAPLTELLGTLTGESRELVEEDPDVVGKAVDHVEQFVPVIGQLHGRRPPRLGDALARRAITSSMTWSWIAARSSSLEPM